MFKLPAFVLLTLAIAGYQPTHEFTVLPHREMVTADNGVPIALEFKYEKRGEWGKTYTGVTAYCANGQPSSTPMSTSEKYKLSEPGFMTNLADMGRPSELTYYTVSYRGITEVLQEVCKATEEDQD
ncbi:hypothetical protein [Nostoc sp.]|uniref:hypothetical protein n=1 Tax=Nostoc sp. TaxID=1180 RepID=UPI002FF72E68